MEKVTTKKLALYSGRTHPELAAEVADHLGIELGHAEHRRVRQRRDPAALRRERPRHRRLHHAEPLRHRRPLGQRLDHGAADHDRRRLPGVGQADHRRLPVLRLRPPGPQGRGPRADHGPPRRRHVQGRRRQADDLDRPPRRPDPGLLRRPGRPPHGDARARGLPARARRRRRSSSRPTPAASRSPSGWPSTSATAAPTWRSSTSAGPKGTANVAEATEVIGDVEGRLCVLTDDMIDTAGTIMSAAELLIDARRHRGVGDGHPRRAVGPGDRPAEEQRRSSASCSPTRCRCRPRSRSTRSRCCRSPR